MDRGSKAYTGSDGKVTTQTHARGTNAAGAGGQAQKVVNCLAGVFVVGFEGLSIVSANWQL